MKKLLVVDDETDICDFLKLFFKKRDFQVFVGHNGKEAIRLVEQEDPDVVLLDIKMPVMDGMDALREIKKMTRKCKVIMVSSISDAQKISEARELGAVEYITKPLLLDHLEKTVLSVIEGTV